MASNNSSWMPASGRYDVGIGTSLSRALAASKLNGKPAPASKPRALPDREFYSFRYNFKPPSIDPEKPGTIEVKRGKDSSSVTVQRPSIQPGEGHMFVGSENISKAWDCVLTFDEVTNSYTLEKLDSHMALTYDRKVPMPEKAPAPASPMPPPTRAERTLTYEEELEQDLLGAEEDADGDDVDDFDEIIPPQSIAYREEEEEEEIVIPPRSPSPPKPKPPPPPRVQKPPAKVRQVPTPVPAPAPVPVPAPAPAAAPAPAKPKPTPTSRGKKNKREPEPAPVSPQYHHLSDAEEEDLEFGKPAKRARPSPPSEGLALPGVSSAIYTPPPPVVSATAPSASTSTSHRVARPSALLPPPPPPAPVSESEEEWDEVAAVNTNADDGEDDFDIFGDTVVPGGGGDGEEIDVNAFERELNLQMEESDDDFLAAAVSPEPDEEPVRGVPISLKQFAEGANGVTGYGSEDDYSSSDESDDD